MSEAASERKVDRYGWFQADRSMSKSEAKMIAIEAKKENERTNKWIRMMDKWDEVMEKDRSKIARRVKKGIPDAIRQKAWKLILNYKQAKNELCRTPMSELLEYPKHEGYVTIDKDLSRTFPQIGFFSKPGFIESLRRVLYCYCQIDPPLGYTQGMSFLAGMLLAYMDEQSAFVCFVSMMKGQFLSHREYLVTRFPRLVVANKVLEHLMKQHCKKALAVMNECNICFPMFTTSWFLTAYQAFNWPPELQLRLFERFLFYGTRALMGFALTIVLRHVDILESGSIEKILACLQHPDESERMRDWHEVFEQWEKVWIRKKEWKKIWDAAVAETSQ